jgi:hypothetical protein
VGRGERKPVRNAKILGRLPISASPSEIFNRQLQQLEILPSLSKQRPDPFFNRQLFHYFFFAYNFPLPPSKITPAALP